MGTEATVRVEASDREAALAASEAAVRALEAAEARLSTWTDDSELARLNLAPVGEPVALSPELAAELLEKNPNRYLVRVYRRHAELLESLGRRDEAMELLKKAVAIGEYEHPRVRLPRLARPASRR